MRAYRCDLCKEYCDNVWSIHGLSQPETHLKICGIENTVGDCCKDCYDKIMVFVETLIK